MPRPSRTTTRTSTTRRHSTVSGRILSKLPGFGVDESTLLLGYGLAIGASVGVAVLGFYWLIGLAHSTALETSGGLGGPSWFAIMLVVLVGFAIARGMVRWLIDDSDGDNIPDVMRAVAKRGGRIQSYPVAVKTAAAAVAIGAGGSVGAEGPVAVAGSALGSRMGGFFRSSPRRLRLLVACGAAAGISAAFNAPIAGVFFSIEKVMGSFSVNAFPPVLVASVIAAAISRAAFGNTPVIEIPTEYAVGSFSEFIHYGILGVVMGVVAVLYIKAIYRASDVMNKVKHVGLQVLVGALAVGALDVIFRADLWGKGHETLSLEIVGARPAHFLVALAAAKLIATAISIATVRAGGVFTPAIFIGATLGGGIATGLAQFLPGFDIQPEAFALVGMAGLVAGSTHAPLTAIMMVFEMTSDYQLILPLMLTGAISYITAKRLHPESVYSEWLARKGESLNLGRDTNIMESIRVAEAFNRDPVVVSASATVPQILKSIGSSSQTEFPVIDQELNLVGVVSYSELRDVMAGEDALRDVVVAADLAVTDVETVAPSDSLRTALQRLSLRDTHYLPVVQDDDPDRLLGIISRLEILGAYDRELLRRDELEPPS